MLDVLARYDETRRIDVPAGRELLTEGVTSGRLYVLADGMIEVVRGETQVMLISEPGAIFGEMSVLLDVPHTATVRTVVPSSLYAFDDAAKFLRDDPETALVVARLLAQRLNAATSYLVDLKRQFESHGNHLSMVSDVLASLLHHQETAFTPGSDRQPDPGM
ncbi:Crp/Fnr family transcriptional regulator [Kaistia dalseonensis]|uniref:CRP-like cAMP-binding protein n=1 Tax=Kaistia dalseonensis TaxID=410840 RepID=A0ABU0H4V3_9HYPH|nr:Crp/Fnr family transcriptional regulator [Kaistia dalseonensis]MCX5494766.1 Crp/Fnr family transcriptional regulator [Kaistia dalseonensis]MDQ0437347.1 CRP-like cAMP-binding protein [Kaistia dalseonensis]